MKRLFKITGIIFLSVFVIIAILLVNIIWFKPLSIRIFYEKAFIEMALNQPELISQLGLPIRYFNDKFSDSGPESMVRMNKLLEKSHRTLLRYNHDRLNEREKQSYEILNWFLTDATNGVPWQFHNYPVNQLYGIQSELPSFMDSYHRVRDEKDARDYLRRLSLFTEKFNQVIESLEKREELGIIPPKFVIEKVLLEMKNFIDSDVEKNILWFSFRDKLVKSKIDSEKHQEFLSEVKSEVENSVYPAYRSLISYFENLYPKATTDDGVWKFPDGDAYYQHLLHSNTHSNLSPEEIHQIGLKEVARIQDEMKEILISQGYAPENSFKELMFQLVSDERFLYPDIKDSYEQIIKDYQAIIDHIEDNLGDAFNRRPKARVEVRRVPEFKEATSPFAYYSMPAVDGSRPGVFYINQRQLSEHIKYKMATLTYHEAVPGHHFQSAIQQEMKGVPFFRKIVPFTVYLEGWAMYAEYLAWELGFHSDPYTNVGRLDGELFRAVRLVVDTGIHHKRWTREQAIDYMYENTGSLLSDVETEVERYIVMPGQACSYKMGMIQILEMRQKAIDALGENFRIADFHDVIISNGAMPMSLLGIEVDKYIERKLQTLLTGNI
jgi:uncharacterized protein (DUF885 family)